MHFFRLTFLFLLIVSLKFKAAVCTATVNGNWNSASTWSCGRVPLCTDEINIGTGINVTISSQINYDVGGCTTQAMKITVSGSLTCENGNKLTLPNSSYVVVTSTGKIIAGSGGGSSNWIKIGTLDVWTAGDGTVAGPFALNNSCEITNNSPLTFSPSGCGTTLLPVSLVDFAVNCISDGTSLYWSTASESNNDYFLIEKSYNANNWQFITKVSGKGTSSSLNHYSYTDPINANQLTYYRLSQVDYDGKKEVFKAIDVNCENNSIDQLLFYPNPSSSELNILINVKNASLKNNIKLLNQFGQIVLEKEIELSEGINNLNLDLNVDSGTYSLIFISDNITLPTQKLIVIK